MPSYWDEDLAILSAENVNFSVETAGLGSRFAAATIDLTLQGLVLCLVLLGINGFTSYVLPADEIPKWVVNVCIGLGILLSFLLFNGYYFLFEWLWDGQTPGKRRLGLRVMMANGMPLLGWAAFTRNVVRTVDFLPFCYGLGSVVALLNPLNQRAGDLVAGTIVARERGQARERKPLTVNDAVELFLAAATTIPGTGPVSGPVMDSELEIQLQGRVDPEAAALALILSREDYELARDFLLRRDNLPRLSRERLGHSLSRRMATKLGHGAPADQEAYLQSIVSTLARAYGR